MKEIKNIIFDVGNVLFKYYPEYIIKSLLPKCAHTEFYLNELFNSDIWTSLDKGSLTAETAIKEISNLEHTFARAYDSISTTSPTWGPSEATKLSPVEQVRRLFKGLFIFF